MFKKNNLLSVSIDVSTLPGMINDEKKIRNKIQEEYNELTKLNINLKTDYDEIFKKMSNIQNDIDEKNRYIAQKCSDFTCADWIKNSDEIIELLNRQQDISRECAVCEKKLNDTSNECGKIEIKLNDCNTKIKTMEDKLERKKKQLAKKF